MRYVIVNTDSKLTLRILFSQLFVYGKGRLTEAYLWNPDHNGRDNLSVYAMGRTARLLRQGTGARPVRRALWYDPEPQSS